MTDLSQADLDYYNKIVQTPEDFNINDLRRAYYIGVLGGEVTPGGPLSTFEQYIYDQILDVESPLHLAIVAAAPPGPQGPVGAQGPQGPAGADGQSIQITGTVATYAALPGGLGPADQSKGWVVLADGLLYIWNGSAFPSDGSGVPVTGPQGPVGPQGIQGLTGPQGPQGIQGPIGPAGPAGSGGGDWNTLLNKPSTFPPSAHSHTATEISNATAVGRSVLMAVDAQTARAAIGAGTGNGTSNLTLGTTATTAAPGNHTHTALNVGFTPAAGLTATDVQTAIQQAASMGGSSVANVLIWRYASGAYPNLPASKPTGIELVQAFGPTAPTNVPAWVGNLASQALGLYEYAALT